MSLALGEIVSRGLVTRLDHAGYLGRELEKAEIAIGLGRSYSQDEPLFPTKN
jgi:dihydropteroate synthase